MSTHGEPGEDRMYDPRHRLRGLPSRRSPWGWTPVWELKGETIRAMRLLALPVAVHPETERAAGVMPATHNADPSARFLLLVRSADTTLARYLATLPPPAPWDEVLARLRLDIVGLRYLADLGYAPLMAYLRAEGIDTRPACGEPGMMTRESP